MRNNEEKPITWIHYEDLAICQKGKFYCKENGASNVICTPIKQ